jgi:hypothetical protein
VPEVPGLPPSPEVPLWLACAYCPNDAQPQNGRHAGERNVFQAGDTTLEVVHHNACRRVHAECLPLALAAGATERARDEHHEWQPALF